MCVFFFFFFFFFVCDQRYFVAHGGRQFVGRVHEAAIAVDGQHRHVGPRMLRAERGGVTPAEIVLEAGREKCARLVDREGEAGCKAELRYLVDEDAVFGQFSAGRPPDRQVAARQLVQPLARTLA